MNKKAVFESIENIVNLMFLIIVFMTVVLMARGFIVQKVDIFEAESKLLTHRIFLSDSISFVDSDTGRLHMGVVDLQEFNSDAFEDKIMNSIYFGDTNKEASARIVLKDLENDKEFEKFYNRELYKEKKVLVEAKLTGKGSASKLDTDFYVLIRDGNKLKRGVLTIEAILPNR